MQVKIIPYNDSKHREQVTGLWTAVFGYSAARNNPEFSIDKKLAHGDGLFWVAEESDRVRGTIMAGYDGHRGWLYSLAVATGSRFKQIGTELLKQAEEKLKQLGCVKINLQILSSNEAVKQFYMKNGYNVEERISMGKVME